MDRADEEEDDEDEDEEVPAAKVRSPDSLLCMCFWASIMDGMISGDVVSRQPVFVCHLTHHACQGGCCRKDTSCLWSLEFPTARLCDEVSAP